MMLAPTSVAIAVIAGAAAGLIFYVAARMLRGWRVTSASVADDPAPIVPAVVNDRNRAAADETIARLIKAFERID